MARERASIGVEIWGDADFRDLTPAAQMLWFKLYSHPHLNYAGVVDFHPGRLAALSREQKVLDVMQAAQELSEKHWAVFDQTTDEVLVRGFLRHDGLLKQWRMAISAATAYAGIGSNKIRAVIVHEFLRYQSEHPELEAWAKPQVAALLKQPAIAVQDTDTDLVLPFGVEPPRVFNEPAPVQGQVAVQPAPETSRQASSDPRYDRASEQGYDLGLAPGLPQTAGAAQTPSTPAPTPATTPATGPHGPRTADELDESTATARASASQVDYAKVAAKLAEQAGEPVPASAAMEIIREVIQRAKPRAGDRTGLVLRSIVQDWAEWSQVVFGSASRDRLVAAGIEPPALDGMTS